MLVKLCAPYIFPYMPYSFRAVMCGVLMGLCYALVYLPSSTFLQLCGVVCVSVQSGTGESTCLALSQVRGRLSLNNTHTPLTHDTLRRTSPSLIFTGRTHSLTVTPAREESPK